MCKEFTPLMSLHSSYHSVQLYCIVMLPPHCVHTNPVLLFLLSSSNVPSCVYCTTYCIPSTRENVKDKIIYVSRPKRFTSEPLLHQVNLAFVGPPRNAYVLYGCAITMQYIWFTFSYVHTVYAEWIEATGNLELQGGSTFCMYNGLECKMVLLSVIYCSRCLSIMCSLYNVLYIHTV